jgi:hypothetical protein
MLEQARQAVYQHCAIGGPANYAISLRLSHLPSAPCPGAWARGRGGSCTECSRYSRLGAAAGRARASAKSGPPRRPAGTPGWGPR